MRWRFQIAEDVVEKVIGIGVACISILVTTVISKTAFAWPSNLRLSIVEDNNLINTEDGACPSDLSC